jgi:hypothetical protein
MTQAITVGATAARPGRTADASHPRGTTDPAYPCVATRATDPGHARIATRTTKTGHASGAANPTGTGHAGIAAGTAEAT